MDKIAFLVGFALVTATVLVIEKKQDSQNTGSLSYQEKNQKKQ